MRLCALLFFVLSGLCCSARDFESDFPILEGDYELIGRKFDSEASFVGRISIREVSPNRFTVVRVINGLRIDGEGRVELATHDRIPVFRMHFVEGGKAMEGTFLWCSDLDNYGRISGYVYPVGYVGGKPGIEALFVARR